MNLEQFSQNAQRQIMASHQRAKRAQASVVSPWYLLATLLDDTRGICARLCKILDVDRTALQEAVAKKLAQSAKMYGNTDPQLDQDYITLLEQAPRCAEQMSDQHVLVEHLFLAFFYQDGYAKKRA